MTIISARGFTPGSKTTFCCGSASQFSMKSPSIVDHYDCLSLRSFLGLASFFYLAHIPPAFVSDPFPTMASETTYCARWKRERGRENHIPIRFPAKTKTPTSYRRKAHAVRRCGPPNEEFHGWCCTLDWLKMRKILAS